MAEYAASLEWVCDHTAVLRLHDSGGGLGDPYTWSATVVRRGDVAELKGVLAAPPLSAIPALWGALAAAGFRRRFHERIKGGRRRPVSRSLTGEKATNHG